MKHIPEAWTHPKRDMPRMSIPQVSNMPQGPSRFEAPRATAVAPGRFEAPRATAVAPGRFEAPRATAAAPGRFEAPRATAVAPGRFEAPRATAAAPGRFEARPARVDHGPKVFTPTRREAPSAHRASFAPAAPSRDPHVFVVSPPNPPPMRESTERIS